MNAPSHLTDEQIARYRGRTLAPADLLDADDHLAGCESCRERLASGLDAGRQAARLLVELSTHLDYDDIVACVEGRGTEGQQRHLGACDMCRAEVADLGAFRVELQETLRKPVAGAVEIPRKAKRSWKWLAAAAVVALAADIGFWAWLNGRVKPAPVAGNRGTELSTAVLPFERAPILDRLVSRPGALLGATPAGTDFALVGPMGTAVVADRPVFRWKPLSARATYVVSIVDEEFRPVLASPPVRGTEWQPDRPLPRGVVLDWQVTAHSGGTTVHAPTPPAPEARLEIVSAPDAEAIEAARRDYPGDHLRIAALCVKAGALDDAEAELNALDAKTAEPYRETLRKMRESY